MNSENLNNRVEGQANNKNNQITQVTLINNEIKLYTKEFEKALPKGLEGIDLDRFIRSCKSAIKKNPKLEQCTVSSLIDSFLSAAFYGFLPNSEKGYLIPYNGEASFQLGYKGCLELLYRTNQIAVLDCMEVYKDDHFKCEYGSNKIFQHIPALEKEDRGEIILFYVYAKLKNGEEKFVILTKKEADIIKNSAKAGKVWATHPVEMSLKSVLIKFFKFFDITPDKIHGQN